jgi:hypothetical protein
MNAMMKPSVFDRVGVISILVFIFGIGLGSAFIFYHIHQRSQSKLCVCEPCPNVCESEPCSEPCLCEPDELHRLEVNLYGIHNQLARSYDQIAAAITEIQDARSVVDRLKTTPQEESDGLSEL